jgi:hypothetical protein
MSSGRIDLKSWSVGGSTGRIVKSFNEMSLVVLVTFEIEDVKLLGANDFLIDRIDETLAVEI